MKKHRCSVFARSTRGGMSLYKTYQDHKYIWYQLNLQDIPDKDLTFILHLNELLR